MLLAASLVTPSRAQEATNHQPPATSVIRRDRPHRSGLWGDFGFGPGATRIGCAGCTDVRFSPGNTGLFRIGGVITDKVLLGFESFSLLNEKFGFLDGDSSIVSENTSLQGVVLWYPWRGGVFLKGGVGIANGSFTVHPDSGADVRTNSTGIGLSLGLGFDRPISRKFALSLNAAAYITGIGDITVGSTFVDDVIVTVYQLNVGIAFR